MFYSKSSNGFYLEEFNGTNIPEDAIEITQEEHDVLIAGPITVDDNGRPIPKVPPPPTTEQLSIAKIIALESEITPRRQRESILGLDKGWLADQDAAIANLRKNLPKQ